MIGRSEEVGFLGNKKNNWPRVYNVYIEKYLKKSKRVQTEKSWD